ncbi:MAG: hypothetical protein M3619_18500 [Myxococcota bacterium]|nr:hypothetical protein [Myxococcota bacterium]
MFGACYAPEVSDCTVTCTTSAAKCAADQVCGSDGYCAAPEVAGQCEGGGSTMVALRIVIEGGGRVTVKGIGECRSDAGGDCTWQLEPARSIELSANGDLAQWTSGCSGSASTCLLAPTSATIVGARFATSDDD